MACAATDTRLSAFKYREKGESGAGARASTTLLDLLPALELDGDGATVVVAVTSRDIFTFVGSEGLVPALFLSRIGNETIVSAQASEWSIISAAVGRFDSDSRSDLLVASAEEGGILQWYGDIGTT